MSTSLYDRVLIAKRKAEKRNGDNVLYVSPAGRRKLRMDEHGARKAGLFFKEPDPKVYGLPVVQTEQLPPGLLFLILPRYVEPT